MHVIPANAGHAVKRQRYPDTDGMPDRVRHDAAAVFNRRINNGPVMPAI